MCPSSKHSPSVKFELLCFSALRIIPDRFLLAQTLALSSHYCTLNCVRKACPSVCSRYSRRFRLTTTILLHSVSTLMRLLDVLPVSKHKKQDCRKSETARTSRWPFRIVLCWLITHSFKTLCWTQNFILKSGQLKSKFRCRIAKKHNKKVFLSWRSYGVFSVYPKGGWKKSYSFSNP